MKAFHRIVAATTCATAVLAISAVAYAAPHPVITATPSSGVAPLQVTVDATQSKADPGQAITAISWNLGNGQVATTPSFLTTYTAPGTYRVTLAITQSDGQSAQAVSDLPVSAAPDAATIALASSRVVYGRRVTVTGTFPGAVRAPMVIERTALKHRWKIARRASTGPTGSFSTSFKPSMGGVYRARLTKTGATTPAVVLTVVPTVRIVNGGAFAFAGASATIRVAPSSYAGKVTFSASLAGKVTGRESKRVRKGVVTITVPTKAFGKYRLIATANASGGLAAATTTKVVRADGRAVSPGSSGPDIRFLRTRLAALAFIVPRVSSTYSWQLYDSVLAFQKAYGFSRTGTMTTVEWRKLMTAHVIHARYTGKGSHLEVDQGRQIGMYVVDGIVTKIWPVSTGAGGATPNGTYAVYRKSTYDWDYEFKLFLPYASYIVRGIALHGFDYVPAYPASHGCIRIAQWIAPKVYGIDPIGEVVHVYA